MADAIEIWNNALAAFLNTLQENNVTADLDFLYVLNAPSIEEALINRVNPGTYDATVVGTPEFIPFYGVRGNLATLSYLDSNFNPSTAPSPRFTQDNASMTIYVPEEGASPESRGGFYDGTGGVSIGVMVPPNNTNQYRINTNTASVSGFVQTSAIGMWTVRRQDAAQIHMDKNGVRFSSFNNASVPPKNGNLRICGQSNTSIDNHAIGMAAAGRLTESQGLTLWNAWETFLQALEALNAIDAETGTYGVTGSSATLRTTRLPSKIAVSLVSGQRVPDTSAGGNSFEIPLGDPSEKRRIVAVIQTRGVPTSVSINDIPCEIINNVQYTNMYSSYSASIITAMVPTGTTGTLTATGIEDNQMWALGIWAVTGNDTTISSRYASSYSNLQDIQVLYTPENNGVGIAHIGNYHPAGTLNIDWEGFNKDFDDLHNGAENSYSGSSIYNEMSSASYFVRPVPQGTVSQNLHYFQIQLKGPDLLFVKADPGEFIFCHDEQDFTTGGYDLDHVIASRNSTGTYFSSSATMEVAPVDTPRVDFSRGLLVEPQRTNLVIQSMDLSTSPWSWGAPTTPGTVTAGDPAPLAGQTFWNVSSTGSLQDRRQSFPVTPNTTQVYSVFVKKGNAVRAGFQVHFLGGTGTQIGGFVYNFDTGNLIGSGTITTNFGIIDIGNGIYRIWAEVSPTGNQPNAYVLVHRAFGIDAGDITQYWGVQGEYGTGPCTSFIPTVATSETREADTITLYGPGIHDWTLTLGDDSTYQAIHHDGSLQVTYDLLNNYFIKKYLYQHCFAFLKTARRIPPDSGLYNIVDGELILRSLKRLLPESTSYLWTPFDAIFNTSKGIFGKNGEFYLTGLPVTLNYFAFKDKLPYKESTDDNQDLPYTGITEYGYSVHGTDEQGTSEDQ